MPMYVEGKFVRSMVIGCMLAVLQGCSEPVDSVPEETTFPADRVADLRNGGGAASGDGSDDGGPNTENIRGMAYSVDGETLVIAETQVLVTQTPQGGTITASAVDISGTTHNISFTFTTVGQSLPKTYELSIDPQVDPNVALLSYAQVVSDGAPVTLDSIADAQFVLESFDERRTKGSFAFDANLSDDTSQVIANGSFYVEFE